MTENATVISILIPNRSYLPCYLTRRSCPNSNFLLKIATNFYDLIGNMKCKQWKNSWGEMDGCLQQHRCSLGNYIAEVHNSTRG